MITDFKRLWFEITDFKHLWFELSIVALVVTFTLKSMMAESLEAKSQINEVCLDALIPLGVIGLLKIIVATRKIRKKLGLMSEVDTYAAKLLLTTAYASEEPTCVKNNKFQFVMANAAFCNKLNVTEDSLLGKNPQEVLPPEIALAMTELDRATRDKKSVVILDTATGPKQITWSLARIIKTPIYSNTNEFLGIVTTIRNMAEWHKASELALAQRLQYQTLFEALEAGIYLAEFVRLTDTECDARLIRVNSAFLKLVGRDATETSNNTLLALWPTLGKQNPSLFTAIAHLNTNKNSAYIEDWFPVFGKYLTIKLDRLDSNMFFATHTDITEKTANEAEIKRLNKRLSGDIAEFRAQLELLSTTTDSFLYATVALLEEYLTSLPASKDKLNFALKLVIAYAKAALFDYKVKLADTHQIATTIGLLVKTKHKQLDFKVSSDMPKTILAEQVFEALVLIWVDLITQALMEQETCVISLNSKFLNCSRFFQLTASPVPAQLQLNIDSSDIEQLSGLLQLSFLTLMRHVHFHGGTLKLLDDNKDAITVEFWLGTPLTQVQLNEDNLHS